MTPTRAEQMAEQLAHNDHHCCNVGTLCSCPRCDRLAGRITTALAEARREVWIEAAGEVQAARLGLDNPPRPIAAINADLNELAYKFRLRSRPQEIL